MATRMISTRRLFFVLLLILAALLCYGQPTSQAISISALTGPKIDKFEFNKFKLYDIISTDRKTFDYAKIVSENGKNLKMMIYNTDGTVTGFDVNDRYVNELKQKISYEGRALMEMIVEARDLLNKGEKPELRLTLENGTILVGSLISIVEDKMEVESDLGKVSILIEDLDRIELAGKDFQPDYRYTFTNPNSTRYLFAPSAIPLRQGEGYYQNVWVTLNSVNYGITDHISITGGLELISTLSTIFISDFSGAFAFANFKIAAPVSEKIHIGGGFLGGGILGEDIGDANMGIAYGLLTTGNAEHNATLGIGYGMVSGDWAKRPIVVLNGMTRINKRIGLVTENWFVSSHDEYSYEDYYDGLMKTYTYNDFYMALSGGMRIMSEKITVDIALITAGNIGSRKVTSSESGTTEKNTYTDWVPIPIPYLDLVYKF